MQDGPDLNLVEPWADALSRAGLATFDALMRSRRGVRMASHKRGGTYRIDLPDGPTVFLKRDTATMLKHILADWLRGRRSRPRVLREREAMARVERLGIVVSEVIASAERRRWGMAHQGVLLTAAVGGEPLAAYLQRDEPPAARRAVLAEVGRTVAKLYQAGLSWPDLLSKHVFIGTDGRIGLIDLERLTPVGDALREQIPQQARQFCRSLRARGATDDDLTALLAGIAHSDMLGAREMLTVCPPRPAAPTPVAPADGVIRVRRPVEMDGGAMLANGAFAGVLQQAGATTAAAAIALAEAGGPGRAWQVHRFRSARGSRQMMLDIARVASLGIPTYGLVATGRTAPPPRRCGFAITTRLPAATLADAAAGGATSALRRAARTLLAAMHAGGLTHGRLSAGSFRVGPDAADGGPVVYLADIAGVRKVGRSRRRAARRQAADVAAVEAIVGALDAGE